ncbi:MarR family winged helix-turn-helix transcriptional regulator [Emcibacter sp.]|uniref:MarR family winged helix-turn-helix transcriptional regulator n=1 Tax=Emcibacter sp. TaxID=1979954 RepID=UPI003A93AD97
MSNNSTVPFQTTLHVRDHCLCLHVQRAARALARHFDDTLRPFGITSGQFSLMMSLNRPAPPNISSVSNLLGMDRTTLTAALKPLERRGLVKSAPDENDRRSRCLNLTEAGMALLVEASSIWEKEHAALESRITPLSPDDLRTGLNQLSGWET